MKRILKTVSIPVELGGGIRSYEDVTAWLDMGISRVIFGTIAVEKPDLIQKVLNQFGAEKVVVGIDARDNKIAIDGWQKQTKQNVVEFALAMKKIGVQRIIYTDINRDGLLMGPDIENTANLARTTHMQVIASGGITRLEDIQALVDTKVPELEGAIIGTVLYENKINLEQVIEMFQ